MITTTFDITCFHCNVGDITFGIQQLQSTDADEGDIFAYTLIPACPNCTHIHDSFELDDRIADAVILVIEDFPHAEARRFRAGTAVVVTKGTWAGSHYTVVSIDADLVVTCRHANGCLVTFKHDLLEVRP